MTDFWNGMLLCLHVCAPPPPTAHLRITGKLPVSPPDTAPEIIDIPEDFLTGSGSQPCALLKCVNISVIPRYKFKHSSSLPNIRYNCAVLFWSQLHWLFRYASKYIFLHEKKILIDPHVKISDY